MSGTVGDAPEDRREAQRQRALLAAIAAPRVEAGGVEALGVRERGARADAGLAAYRANVAALAWRALGAAFPTLAAMLGEDDFRRLAREFVRAHPPERGDAGEWGAVLPGWVGAHPGLADWPWFADCARVDWAVHGCERAADASFDAGSLQRLAAHEPEQLGFVALPGTTLVESLWPVATIHAAHRGAGDLDAMRAALGAGRAENALIVRSGWRAAVHAVDDASATWWRGVLAGARVDVLLAGAPAEVDLARWLADALRLQALQGVHCVAD